MMVDYQEKVAAHDKRPSGLRVMKLHSNSRPDIYDVTRGSEFSLSQSTHIVTVRIVKHATVFLWRETKILQCAKPEAILVKLPFKVPDSRQPNS